MLIAVATKTNRNNLYRLILSSCFLIILFGEKRKSSLDKFTDKHSTYGKCDDFSAQGAVLEKLMQLGIDREKMELMPDGLKVPLLCGEVTPVFMANTETSNGKVIQLPMKAQFVLDDNGQVLLMTYPLRREIANELGLNQNELQRVLSGEVIRKEVDVEGERKVRFVQLDKETNSLMHRNVASIPIETELQTRDKVKDIELGANQKEALQEGKPVELALGDTKVTVGVDLREPQGFKIVNGDMREWERLQQMRYDDAHEEFMGYVMTDENRWEYQKVVERQAMTNNRSESIEKKQHTGLIR